MPWQEVEKVELRCLFIHAVESGQMNFSEACCKFNISRTCGYKWWRRFQAEGVEGLVGRSRRPVKVSHGTESEVVEAIIQERRGHPAWGARKLMKRLEKQGLQPPSERTVNRVLKRAGLICVLPSQEEPLQRFERSRPNALWQMDHKKRLRGVWTARVVPFSVLDDASRYCLGLWPLPDKGLVSTWSKLWELFGVVGLPEAILSDNAPTFAGINGPSRLEADLMRLGIDVLHGRTYHPQTQGKIERFYGTLERELLRDGCFSSPGELTSQFDRFRQEYNFERPHEALEMNVPGSRYHPSSCPRPATIPQMVYPAGLTLRKVMNGGYISYRNHRIRVGWGLMGDWLEVRDMDWGIEIYYGPYRILGTDLKGYEKYSKHYRKTKAQ